MKRYLRMTMLQKKLSLSKSKIYSDIADKLFPTPVKFGKSSLWIEDEINAFMKFCSATERSENEIRKFVADLILERGNE